MDSPWREPYPPMIKLDIEPASNSGAVSSSRVHIYVDVVGVGEKKQFVLCPKIPQGTLVTLCVVRLSPKLLLPGLSPKDMNPQYDDTGWYRGHSIQLALCLDMIISISHSHYVL